ncbi:methylisocitrate lyase [Sciscionella sediminilitoris]|uniref:methylisocitrate lyase n=1 Tax=Sciscionella sediminilitoris TaxID=1445613 RepID=UPI0004DFB7BC|nr:methylisocitrate lyase [Sciscionella sp. SE31]
MLHSTKTPAQKRAAFRERLRGGELLRLPGAFNPLSAKLIQDKGMEGVYLSGSVIAADLGLPDIGLTTLTEVAGRAGQVARVTELPVLVDADTGFGEAMNVARTVQCMEDAGVAGIHLEDQVNPKRCGHLDGKHVVPLADAVQRIRAAVQARRDPNFLIMARTDARGVSGMDEAIERAKAYADAGADAIFPEAMTDLEEFAAMRAAVDVPILANMTEFGKSELFSTAALAEVGVNLVIFPVSLLRLAMGGAERALDTITEHGTLESLVPQMQTRARLYELLDYESYSQFDSGVYDFTV